MPRLQNCHLTMTGRDEKCSVLPWHVNELQLGERSSVSGANNRDLTSLILFSNIFLAHGLINKVMVGSLRSLAFEGSSRRSPPTVSSTGLENGLAMSYLVH